MDEGRQIDESDEQLENADSPRVKSLHPDPNVTLESFSQQLKQPLQIVSTHEGIQIDCSDEQL
jgi:hypothetical protein